MNNSNQLIYSTNDFALAVTLLCLGFIIINLDKTNPVKVYFLFERSNRLDQAINDFWNNQILVNPKVFFNTQKELKARIYSSN
ncbi:hypothetical protein COZ22_01405 [bacterium (Candidatus Howlettbacteria) CG_4_10_14_3_um_filter_37_10]|nr:MAG: hypothetical protein COX25_03490 [bacterium (Candidatus Howlettbacteria) CG23_combo_of_CG06-09_8_20_14_all_37_9]PIX99980.1 MAG: hypothetical protein COZ22_01405 [bacterium (Candidatus Howlettbacteria) CG_4_10_14_3_um_filter_37_10]